jgi:DNA-binding XRE family transcriptional regulator
MYLTYVKLMPYSPFFAHGGKVMAGGKEMTTSKTKSNKKPVDKDLDLARNLPLKGQLTDVQMMEALQRAIAISQAGESASLTTGELAQRIGVSRQTVENWVKQGLFPGIVLDARTVIAPAKLARAKPVERTVGDLEIERQQTMHTQASERMQPARKEWARRKQGK